MAKENLSIPRGTRDFGPQQMMVRNHIFSTIRGVFEQFGFAPLETPSMENLSVLTGKYGDEGDQLIYKILNSGDYLSDVQSDDFQKGHKALLRKISEKALRYDLTVPLARYVVMNRNTLTFPFKRYQMQPVWRADRPSFGRYREFYQCDADVVGTRSLICEVEIMQMICEVLEKLEVTDFIIKVNHRKILAGLAEFCGASGRESDMSVSLDKLDKVEWDVVANDLSQKGFSIDFIEKIKGLRSGIIPFTGIEFQAILEKLKGNELAATGFSDLNAIVQLLTGFPEVLAKLRFDINLARGLSYYTGPIFEVIPIGVKIGSISGGGRYDELTSVFGVDGIPGVGFSFGIDRVYDLLSELGKTSAMPLSAAKVLVVQFDESQVPYYLQLLSELRSDGIPCELYPEPAKLKKQFAYADAKQIPFVVVAGEDEIKENLLTVKDLKTGTQEKLSLKGLIDHLHRL